LRPWCRSQKCSPLILGGRGQHAVMRRTPSRSRGQPLDGLLVGGEYESRRRRARASKSRTQDARRTASSFGLIFVKASPSARRGSDRSPASSFSQAVVLENRGGVAQAGARLQASMVRTWSLSILKTGASNAGAGSPRLGARQKGVVGMSTENDVGEHHLIDGMRLVVGVLVLYTLPLRMRSVERATRMSEGRARPAASTGWRRAVLRSEAVAVAQCPSGKITPTRFPRAKWRQTSRRGPERYSVARRLRGGRAVKAKRCRRTPACRCGAGNCVSRMPKWSACPATTTSTTWIVGDSQAGVVHDHTGLPVPRMRGFSASAPADGTGKKYCPGSASGAITVDLDVASVPVSGVGQSGARGCGSPSACRSLRRLCVN